MVASFGGKVVPGCVGIIIRHGESHVIHRHVGDVEEIAKLGNIVLTEAMMKRVVRIFVFMPACNQKEG